jgi:hypothetical protein
MSSESIFRILRGVGEYLPLIIFLVAVPFSMYLSYRRRQSQTLKLKDLAVKLGLQCQWEQQPATLDQAYRQRLASYRGGNRTEAEKAFRRLEQSGFLKSMLSLSQPLAIGGRYNGYQAEIKLVHQNKKSYTEARAFFPEPLGLGLKIVRSGFWNRNLSFGKTAGIETGNAELDKAAAIQARDELKARYLAKSVQSQQALLELFQHKGAEISDQGALIRQDGYQIDYAKCKKMLDDITRALQAIAGSLGVKERYPENSNEN